MKSSSSQEEDPEAVGNPCEPPVEVSMEDLSELYGSVSLSSEVLGFTDNPVAVKHPPPTIAHSQKPAPGSAKKEIQIKKSLVRVDSSASAQNSKSNSKSKS